MKKKFYNPNRMYELATIIVVGSLVFAALSAGFYYGDMYAK